MLPLPFGKRQFKLFNVTECIDALNKELTGFDCYDDGTVANVKEPVFRIDRLGANVFKVPEDSSARVYYWEDEGHWPARFRAVVERAGLTGLEFKFLYSAEQSEPIENRSAGSG